MTDQSVDSSAAWWHKGIRKLMGSSIPSLTHRRLGPPSPFINQMDVTTAFLNRDLTGELYLKRPKLFDRIPATAPALDMVVEELLQHVDNQMSTAQPMEDDVAVDPAGSAEQDVSSPNIERDPVTDDKVVGTTKFQPSYEASSRYRRSFAQIADVAVCASSMASVVRSRGRLRRHPAGALAHDISETEAAQQSPCSVVQPQCGLDPLTATTTLLFTLASQSADPLVQTLMTLVMQLIKTFQLQQEDKRAQQKAFLAVHEQRQTPSRRPPTSTVPEVALVYNTDKASATKTLSAPVQSLEEQTYAVVARRTGGRAWPRAKPIAVTADHIADLRHEETL
ncbi:hypothetical protein RI367_008544 [Sorochytrium milnesiophthora]